MNPTSSPTLLELDSRGRVALGSLGADRQRYLAHRNDDGTIVLEPAVVLSELEARLHANPELHERIKAAASASPEQAIRNRQRRRPRG